MSTNLRKTIGKFETEFPEILASEIGLRSPRMLTLDVEYFDDSTDIIIPPGSILCQLPSGLGRVFATGKATAATAANARVITLGDVSKFKIGDVLTKSTGEALGTIASIAPVAGTVTLVANTATAIAVGDVIKIDAASAGQPYGMVLSAFNATQNSNDVAVYTSCSVFAARLPYWDAALQAAFPEITLVDPIV
jgi:hypothetical protein